MNQQSKRRAGMPRLFAAALTGLMLAGSLGGCVAVAGGAMAGGAMMAVDRRTTGTQIDDQSIEIAASNAIAAAIGDRGRVSATSYNRVVLLTGQVPTEADRTKVNDAVAKVPNVSAVVNEVAVMSAVSLSTQSVDAVVTAKVKAAFVDTPDLQAASIKVVTENGIVYLMGLVTDAEAKKAGEVTRAVRGVRKVVKIFQPITAAQLSALPVPPDAAKPASAPSK